MFALKGRELLRLHYRQVYFQIGFSFEHPCTEVHAEHHSEPQSCRKQYLSSQLSRNAENLSPLRGAHQLMVIGTGISLWRHWAQSQVDSQTHAERRIIIFNYLFN